MSSFQIKADFEAKYPTVTDDVAMLWDKFYDVVKQQMKTDVTDSQFVKLVKALDKEEVKQGNYTFYYKIIVI